jgi:ribose transport system permease protein
MSQASAATAERARRLPRLGLTTLRDYGIVTAFLALFIALSFASDAFLTKANLLNILAQTAPIGIIACGSTLVIIAGGFDLSVGAIFAIAGVVAAKIANSVDPVVGLLAGVLVGLVLGIVNGGLVTVLRINTFIATLASGFVIRGVATLITGGFLISVSDEVFSKIGRDEVLDVKISVYIFIAIILLTGFLLTRTAFGRYIFAVGGNAEAARLSGIRVDLVRTITFMISGACAGLAGVIATSRVSTGQADTGTGLELAAIAAIVIGGTSIMGGEGAIWRSVLGVLLIAMIGNGFNILNIDPFYQSIVQGMIIIVAVAIDSWARRSRTQALRPPREGPEPPEAPPPTLPAGTATAGSER